MAKRKNQPYLGLLPNPLLSRVVALVATGIVFTGCVSNSDEYSEQASRQSQQENSSGATVSNEPVERRSLERPISSQAVENETNQPLAHNVSAPASPPIALSQTASIASRPTENKDPALSAVAQPQAETEQEFTRLQSDLSSPDTTPGSNLSHITSQPAGSTNYQNAFSEDGASPVRTVPAANGAMLLSGIPSPNPLRSAEQGFFRPSLATQNNGGIYVQPVDPLEYAAQQRIPNLFASFKHGKCKSGWGPKPKKIGAKRVRLGDKYYIEIRMRQTPLMPVGHTYVAYGNLGPYGEIITENLVMLAPLGGYVGAAIASGVPVPGVLTPHPDDCRVRPDLAYRVSLSAREYEKLLLEIRRSKTTPPNYLLFANNCNHFMTRIAGSVGLKPPRNIYVPAIHFLHDMIEANEAIKIAKY